MSIQETIIIAMKGQGNGFVMEKDLPKRALTKGKET
jgi:hypothetical protein